MIDTKRLLATFLDLIQIDSTSGNEEAVAQVIFTKLISLGITTERDNYGNIIATLQGTGEPLLLSAHLDTVTPGTRIVPVVTDTLITTNGTTVLGGDPKAGIAVILETLTSLCEDKKTHIPLEIVFTRNEEVGLLGAKHLDYTKISAKRGLIFDGEYHAGTIDISSPGLYNFTIDITGKGAHAGLEPEKGISAIKIAGALITRLPLGRIDEETTVNIGIISGGTVVNAVPENAQLIGEIRSRSENKLAEQLQTIQQHIDQLQKAFPEAIITLRTEKLLNSYVHIATDSFITTIVATYEELGVKAILHDSGTGTDGNIFQEKGIQAVVVSAGDFSPHTTREYVILSEFEKTAQFCQQFIEKLSK